MNTEAKIQETVTACERSGKDSIIVLSGVAGTGKTYVARMAAERFAGHERFVKEIQFHQGYSYEDFIEGLAPLENGGFAPRSGVFLDWNDQARRDTANRYVLLIEEFTRANISAVIGELMTYVEHRNRSFETPITRTQVRVADNLVLLATMNPRDRSALEVDEALIRRLRIIDCPPSTDQLREMLSGVSGTLVAQLAHLFDEVKRRNPSDYEAMMPFGHGIFAGITDETDLVSLWHQRIKHLLYRPLAPAHRFARDIAELYPWKTVPAPAPAQAVPAMPAQVPAAPPATAEDAPPRNSVGSVSG